MILPTSYLILIQSSLLFLHTPLNMVKYCISLGINDFNFAATMFYTWNFILNTLYFIVLYSFVASLIITINKNIVLKNVKQILHNITSIM